ncbi:MAG TPA: ABC transporter ATP-binding protein, partial [Micromonosporaceae bacterium]|nr:ABC transporter ATP-binding protein [Micromonosporaceae bacterium]
LVCSHLLGEVERICDALVAIDGGRLLRSARVASMTSATDVLAVEVTEGGEALAQRLTELGLPVRQEGRQLLVPLSAPGRDGSTADETYDLILTTVADLDLPLHRLEQRRHAVAELFADREAAHV